MGRLDHSGSHGERHSAGRSEHMGCVFFFISPVPHQSSRIEPLIAAIYLRSKSAYVWWRGLTKPTNRAAGDVSKTGPAAASNFDPSYVFTPADVKYVKITFSTIVLYFLVSCTTKLSLLLLLHRIFAISGPFKIQIYIAEATVVAFWISTTVAHCLSCIPIDWSWKNGNADPRYCINYNTFWLVSGIFESVIDVAILSLPLGMVSKLHMERSRKFSVAGVFLLGGL